MEGSPILWAIVACEVGFWVVVLLGLVVRYPLRRPALSRPLLASVVCIDVALLVVVALDLHRGTEVSTVHRLAAIYLGVTVALGHTAIAWADRWFAYRFAGGERPRKPRGAQLLRHEWVLFARWLLAAAIAALVTVVLGYTVASAEQRADLNAVFGQLGVVTVIWLLTGPLWELGRGNARR